jgi:hypothetical protein
MEAVMEVLQAEARMTTVKRMNTTSTRSFVLEAIWQSSYYVVIWKLLRLTC